jgi:hypothetical protein
VQGARRLVFIIAADQRELFESMSRTFAGDSSVHVMLDRRGLERRAIERRRKSRGTSVERRRRERRQNVEIPKSLAQRGYGLVAVIAAKQARRPS